MKGIHEVRQFGCVLTFSMDSILCRFLNAFISLGFHTCIVGLRNGNNLSSLVLNNTILFAK